MKILIQFLGTKEAGPVFAYELAKGFVQNGEDVYAVLHREIENKNQWLELIGEDKIFFFSSWVEKRNLLRTFVAFQKELHQIKSKFEGICFDVAIRPFVSEYDDQLIKAMKCKQIVNFCHDPIAHSGVKKKAAKKNKQLVNRANKIIVLTPSFIPIVEGEYKRKKDDIICVPHGILPYSKKQLAREVKYSSETDICFVFFGRIDPYKGVDILLQAYYKLSQSYRNVRLLIAGSGNVERYKDLLDKQDKMELINRYIENDEVDALFGKPNIVLVIPYKDATQSGVISIAYEYGVPVIATDTGGLREQLFNGKAGRLVKVNDVNSLYEGMRCYLEKDIYVSEVERIESYKEKLMWTTICKKISGELLKTES